MPIHESSLPPGPRLPAAIQTAAWTVHSPTLMDRCYARYGDMFTLNFVARAMSGWSSFALALKASLTSLGSLVSAMPRILKSSI